MDNKIYVMTITSFKIADKFNHFSIQKPEVFKNIDDAIPFLKQTIKDIMLCIVFDQRNKYFDNINRQIDKLITMDDIFLYVFENIDQTKYFLDWNFHEFDINKIK